MHSNHREIRPWDRCGRCGCLTQWLSPETGLCGTCHYNRADIIPAPGSFDARTTVIGSGDARWIGWPAGEVRCG